MHYLNRLKCTAVQKTKDTRNDELLQEVCLVERGTPKQWAPWHLYNPVRKTKMSCLNSLCRLQFSNWQSKTQIVLKTLFSPRRLTSNQSSTVIAPLSTNLIDLSKQGSQQVQRVGVSFPAVLETISVLAQRIPEQHVCWRIQFFWNNRPKSRKCLEYRDSFW